MSHAPALGLLLAAGLACGTAGALEAPSAVAVVIPPLSGFATIAESGPRWVSLTAAQREILAPLEEDWAGIDSDRKQKWLEVASRYPSMSRAEQRRIHDRMAEWARLTPSQRGEARANFQQASRTPTVDRQAQWEAYQALSPEERARLASRAAESARAAQGPRAAAALGSTGASPRGAAAAADARGRPAASSTKTNIVPNPVFATSQRPAGPTVVRSGTGVTTTLVTRQPAPPVHQQPGLPKVAAMPTLVDQTTLLPQRGPQAAAVLGPAVQIPSAEAAGE